MSSAVASAHFLSVRVLLRGLVRLLDVGYSSACFSFGELIWVEMNAAAGRDFDLRRVS